MTINPPRNERRCSTRQPADAEGNFLSLPQWLPGHPQPADWPQHIHPPKEVDLHQRGQDQ